MAYHFRNLVFEGGGVKSIAYIGAMKVLKDEGILQNITRVGARLPEQSTLPCLLLDSQLLKPVRF